MTFEFPKSGRFVIQIVDRLVYALTICRVIGLCEPRDVLEVLLEVDQIAIEAGGTTDTSEWELG